jgi:beta-glucanase (GH16 family)
MKAPLRTDRVGQRLRQGAGLLAAGLGLALLSPSAAQAQCNQIVWQDEFNTPGDLSKWRVYEGDGCAENLCNFGNAELQAYRAANAVVAGGNLTITTRYEPYTVGGRSYNYTSAKLFSKTPAGALQTFKYGRIEASIKIPSAQGVWPAFWMLPDPGNWPSTGEIDIMEAKHKNPTSVAGTIHYDDNGWHFTGRETSGTVDLSTGFHTYAVEWSPNQIKWFIDNTLFHTASPKTTSGGSWPFNDGNFYLMLNSAVGGPSTGFTGIGQNPNPADYPTTMQVDFVRVYKGTYNYAVLGDESVYQNDINKTYRIDAVTGATYSWSVPAGATIVSGQGTNAIQVNWGTSAGGNVAVTTAVSGCPTGAYSLGVTVSPALQLDRLYENFEATRLLTYASATGTLTQPLANPVSGTGNTSAQVARYVRNSSEQYDVISVRNLSISNANDFVAGRRKLYIDVYSTAPVGSKVTVQLENSNLTTATNFPIGRHSAYRAYTSRQNAWETLEFDLERTIDAGTSIYSINNVTLLFQPATNSGATFYFDNVLVKKQPDQPVLATDVLLNYDGTARITQNAAKTNGAYTANFTNPSATGVNTSARVARYVRNSAEQYDVLFFDAGPAGTIIEDAALFKNQTYQIQADVYTAAPVGTAVLLNLQNKAAAAGTYPAGRNSTYEARTTVQNQWQTLTFNYVTSPDGGTANVAIDELAFLFGNNSLTGDTYYVDNIRIIKRAAAPTYSAGTVFENYDAVRNLTLLSATGTYAAAVNNPAATGINTSAKVGQYTRNVTEQYDVLAFRNQLTKDGDAYKRGDKVFAMDVYTSAPAGTVISWQLESSAASRPQNYPTGRHSIYQAVVKQTNTWHTLVFTFASAPDPGTPDADVDNLVFLFAPNTLTGHVYYVDNLRSLSKNSSTPNTPPTVSLTSPANGASFTAPASITVSANAADANGTVAQVQFFNGSTPIGTATSSPYSISWTGVAAGTYSLTAVATDNAGATTTSAAVTVTVGSTPVATNLALNKPTFTSSVENAGTPGSAAVDGNATSTRWSSAFADPQWLYVDLGASYNVSRVKLTWEGAYGRDYLVQTSADAANWTTIKPVTGNTALINDHTGLSGTGRYVRIYGTARGTAWGYSLYELEVYGTPAGTTPPPTGSVCGGTVASGDYRYEVSTTNGTVNWTFVPLTPIAGSTMALIYIKVGSGGYAGYNMTASGSNFTFSQAQPAGAALSFYFTYRVGSTTAERNSSATPHSYTAGATCTGARTALATQSAATFDAPLAFPNPVTEQLSVTLPTAGPAILTLTDALGRVVLTQHADGHTAAQLDVRALRPGVYQLAVRSAAGLQTQKIIKNQ